MRDLTDRGLAQNKLQDVYGVQGVEAHLAVGTATTSNAGALSMTAAAEATAAAVAAGSALPVESITRRLCAGISFASVRRSAAKGQTQVSVRLCDQAILAI